MSKDFLLSLYKPNLVIILSAILGVYVGLNYPSIAASCSSISSIYLSLLQVTILPLIVLSIILSVSNLSKLESTSRILKRLPIVFIILVVLVSAWGVLSSALFSAPIDLANSPSMSAVLQKISVSLIKEVDVNTDIFAKNSNVLTSFLMNSFPKNVFTALATNNVLQTIVFTLLFAFALNSVKNENKATLYSILETSLHAFQFIVSKLIKFLPFGIFFLLADQTKSINMDTLIGMLHFVVACVLSFLALLFLATIVIWKKANELSYFKTIAAFKDAIAISLTTSNTFAALPYTSNALVEKLKYDESSVDLLLPFGITLTRYGNIFYFAFSIIFIAHIYSIPLTSPEYLIAIFGCILAGTATSGATGILTLNLMTIAADPLGIPISGVLALFIAIDPLIDPFRTITTVMYSALATSLIAQKSPAVAEDEVAVSATPVTAD